MQMRPKRLLEILGFEFLLALTVTWAVHVFSQRHGGMVGLLHPSEAYLRIFTISMSVISLTLGISMAISKFLPTRKTRRITLGKGLKLVSEWLKTAKRDTPIQFVFDGPDPGSLVDFKEHRRLLWEIRKVAAKHRQVGFVLVGNPAMLSRANPLRERASDFDLFKKSSQFKQFVLHEKCPSDPTREEFERVAHRYMDRVQMELDDWDIDSWDLPAERAHEVEIFSFRVGSKAVVIKFDPVGQARVLETSDPEYIDFLDSRFKQLLAFSKKRPKRSDATKDYTVLVG